MTTKIILLGVAFATSAAIAMADPITTASYESNNRGYVQHTNPASQFRAERNEVSTLFAIDPTDVGSFGKSSLLMERSAEFEQSRPKTSFARGTTFIAATPEPSSLLLVGTGLVACAAALSFRRRSPTLAV